MTDLDAPSPQPCRSDGCDGGREGKPWNEGGFRAGCFPPALDGYCYGCAYWHETAGKMHAGVVITDESDGRRRYAFDAAQPIAGRNHRGPLGFSGRQWIVRFTDGRTVETNNLWSGGVIPERFHDLFPVNAVLDQPPVKPLSFVADRSAS